VLQKINVVSLPIQLQKAHDIVNLKLLPMPIARSRGYEPNSLVWTMKVWI